jgi:hypothetical protein
MAVLRAFGEKGRRLESRFVRVVLILPPYDYFHFQWKVKGLRVNSFDTSVGWKNDTQGMALGPLFLEKEI